MTRRTHLTPRLSGRWIMPGLLLAACSGSNTADLAPPDAGRTDAGSLAATLDGASNGCASAEPGQGCACGEPGLTVACWTGPASSRGVGGCHDGKRHCVSNGEFLSWGPCGGQQLQCSDAITATGAADAAPVGTVAGSGTGATSLLTGSGSGSGPASVVTTGTGTGAGAVDTASTCSASELRSCSPGTTRWCDDGSCYWGKQTCRASGTWGECEDTPNNSGPSSCPSGSIYYDENCCEQGGACCAHAVNGDNFGSVGNCGATAPCTCKELCAVGAVRWCSVATAESTFVLPDVGGWGKQSCQADATWGSCAAVTTQPTGCSGGSDFGSGYDSTCCKNSGECCEVFDDEDADPASVNCPATACQTQWSASGVPTTGTFGGF